MGLTSIRTKFRDSGKHAKWGLWFILGLALLLPTFFAGGVRGCGKAPSTPQEQAVAERDQTVATVGSAKVTRGQLDDAVTRYLTSMSQGQTPSALQRHMFAPQVLTMLEDQTILIAAAKKQGIEVGNSELKAEIEKRVQAEAQSTGVNEMVGEQQQQMLDQIKAHYDAQRDDVRNELITKKLQDKLQKNVDVNSPTTKEEDIEINARHILIQWKGLKSADKKVTRTKDEAKALATKLTADAQKNPSEFAALAQKNSDEPGADKRAGDLGWFSKYMMVKPFWNAAYAAKVNTIVGPVESAFGYHVIKIEDRRVSQSRQNQEIQKFLAAEKKNVKITVVASDLKAAQAVSDYRMAASGKDKKAAEAKRTAAVAAYETATKDRPNDSALFAMLGSLYRETKQTDKAITAFEQAAKIQPDAEVHLVLGDLYRTSNKRAEALKQYQTAGRLAGSNIQIHQMMVSAYKQMGEKQLAYEQTQWIKRASKNSGQGQTPIRVGG